MYGGGLRFFSRIVPDALGQKAVFTASGDWTGENPDGNSQVWIIDLQTPATIKVGKDAPTLVRWDAEPNPRRYDRSIDEFREPPTDKRPGTRGKTLA